MTDAGASPVPGVDLHAHCLAGQAGGVALLAVNTDRGASHDLVVAGKAERYTLTSAKGLLASTVELNGKPLAWGSNAAMPVIAGAPVAAGKVTLPPASITFLAFRGVANAGCR